jgi:proline iminopeptidase
MIESSQTDSQIFTVNREEFIATIPEAERHDMVLAYHAQLNSVDDQTRLAAAKAWSKWESVSHSLSLMLYQSH